MSACLDAAFVSLDILRILRVGKHEDDVTRKIRRYKCIFQLIKDGTALHTEKKVTILCGEQQVRFKRNGFCIDNAGHLEWQNAKVHTLQFTLRISLQMLRLQLYLI